MGKIQYQHFAVDHGGGFFPAVSRTGRISVEHIKFLWNAFLKEILLLPPAEKAAESIKNERKCFKMLNPKMTSEVVYSSCLWEQRPITRRFYLYITYSGYSLDVNLNYSNKKHFIYALYLHNQKNLTKLPPRQNDLEKKAHEKE